MLYTDLTFISDTDTKGPGQGAVLADYATSMLLSCGKLNLAEQALLRSDTSRLHEQKTYSAYRNFVQGLEGTSEAFLAASAPRVAHMLYHHPEPGPT